MIRSLSGKWKQPLMFTFCRGTTPAANMVVHIKTVVKKCEKVGLTVVASVNDQGSTNVSAVNQL
ncbi:Tnp P element domain containing protein, partial [Asbolus verrucosus]